MYPDGLRYSQEHEWVRGEDGVHTVGISAFATEQLGDVTYVELPEIGMKLERGDDAGSVESVKAASDVYSPIGGRVSEVNHDLEDKPELVNDDPYTAGWFFKLEDVDQSEVDALMDAAAYQRFIAELDQ